MQIQLPATKLLNFIESNSHLFDPPYHERVDLMKYSQKLEENSTHFVIKKGNDIAALLACYVNDRVSETAYISYLCVGEKFQRTGLGKEVLDEVVKYAEMNEFKKLSLEVDKNNLIARKFYLVFGFRDETVKPSSIIMTLTLKH